MINYIKGDIAKIMTPTELRNNGWYEIEKDGIKYLKHPFIDVKIDIRLAETFSKEKIEIIEEHLNDMLYPVCTAKFYVGKFIENRTVESCLLKLCSRTIVYVDDDREKYCIFNGNKTKDYKDILESSQYIG